MAMIATSPDYWPTEPGGSKGRAEVGLSGAPSAPCDPAKPGRGATMLPAAGMAESGNGFSAAGRGR
ncbi:MAG TPA: hypothetical protein VIQ29_22705, partial [Ancylobacter sp.]